MQTLKQILLCLLLASATALCAAGALAAFRVARLAEQASQATVEAQAAIAEAAATLADARQQTRLAVAGALYEISRIETHLFEEVHSVRRNEIPFALQSLDQKLDRAELILELSAARLDGQVSTFNRNLGEVLKPAAETAQRIDVASDLFLNCEQNADCLFNRYVGVSKGAERAFLNFGLMSQEVRAALPRVLENTERTTEASARASLATARTMENLEAASKPFPKWIRLPLNIAGTLAHPVAGALAGAAAVGAFR